MSNFVLFIFSFIFLFSCSRFHPSADGSFSLQIKPDSMFAKNIIQVVQEGLKFVTYLSNDLNIYINETISDSNLQVVDTLFDNSEYYFNIFGFCKRNQFGEELICYNGEGSNIIASFVQDFGTQLGNLTKQPDPNLTSGRFVNVFYTAIEQLCSGPMSLSNPDICKLRTYNQAGFDLQYVGIFNLLCSGLIIFLILGDIVFGYCIVHHGKFQIKWKFIIKLISLILSFLSIQVIYFVNMSMQIPIRELLEQYQIAAIQFHKFNFVIWNIIFIFNIICTIELNLTKMSLVY
ncbi:SMA2 [[Candida] subhashii]|uniref:SMA2 n=1 Tax=[Candida] subhashii TaxID=561895 RepID=A0A8J5QMD6_9ASCO|nr:SMA2 [[Candida] subhashii]KAG7663191.1 SMA2 [[Candida] subhashii]